MAEISKQALKVANNTEFPNNNAGAITPSRLRGFNTDMIDSLVDEISYNADSASWEQSIAALEAFTGSATGLTTGSLLITASANLNTITFTKGDGSTFNVNVNTGSADLTDLGPLNAFTASVAGTNAFTQSANLRLNSLEATTASLNTSVSNLNTFTQSIQTEVNGLEIKTGSYATTGSNTFVGNQTIVGSVSASSFVSASRFVGDGSQITGITASVATTILDDGILQGTATSLNFTGSGITATVVAGVAVIEASIDQSTLGRYTLTSSFNSYTQSADAKINSINGFTASVAGTNTFTASIAGTNAFTQSANARLNSIEAQSGSWVTAAITASSLVTASFSGNTLTFTKGDASTFGVVIPDVSGSATLPAGVVSGSAQIAALGFVSSSVTSSMAVSSSLYAVTASLAREVVVSAINVNQSTLPIGTVVRITGATGDNPQFNSASWESDNASANTLGILANTAVSGQYADITVIGKLVGVNTDGMNAGDVIYLSSSGQFTNVQPQAPLHIVTLGEVLRVQQNNGSIFVNISNGWELNELHNVRITNPLQGDVLVYEASSSLWKNQPSSSITPTDISALNAFTASVAGTNAFTQSIQAEVNGIEAKTGSFATTGSNTFIGTETLIGSASISGAIVLNGDMALPEYYGSSVNAIRLFQGVPGISASSKIQFWSGSYATQGTNYINLQTNPANGALAISAWPVNNHFMDFDGAATASLFTAPIGGTASSPIANTLVVRTNMTVSGSNSITLRVSSSAAGGGVGSFTPLGMTFQSGSGNPISANYGRNLLSLVDTTSAPGTIRYIAMAQNPSLLGVPTTTGYTAPSILAMNSGSQPEPVISFENRGNYTNGLITMVKPTRFLSGSITSGSALITGSLNVIGDTTITGSLTLSSSAAIELNIVGNTAITGGLNFLSGSASGSVITNVGDTFTGTEAVTKIISLSSAEYTALSPKDPNTLYIIV